MIYVKETDTHQYLDFSSCHTYHTKKGIPYGQALRIRRIVSDDNVFEGRCAELKGWLRKRGYPDGMIDEQIDRAKSIDRAELLDRERIREENKRDILVLSYHPCLSKKVHDIVKNAYPILQSDAEHRRVFADLPMVTYRRAKSLGDILIRARVPRDKSYEGCRGCNGRSDCQVCDLIVADTHFTSRATGRTFEIRGGPFHCNSCNVVYLLECKTCSIQYVGSTGTENSDTKFRHRCNDYKSKNKQFLKRKNNGTLDKGKPIPQASLHAHFSQEGHNGVCDFSFKIIDGADSLAEVRKKESFWQYKLKTFLSDGLDDHDVTIY